MDLDRRIHSHPAEEILEEFVFGRLPEDLAVQIEEHLLICPRCQDSVAEIDRFVGSLKAYASRPDLANPEGSSWRDAFRAFGRSAINAGAVTALALAILIFVMIRPAPTNSGPSVAVSLSSMRGGADLLSPAPAGKPLELNIGAPGVGSDNGPFQVQVVDARGKQVWKGSAQKAGSRLTARPSKPLSRGTYWVRLYGKDSRLLEEFGVVVK